MHFKEIDNIDVMKKINIKEIVRNCIVFIIDETIMIFKKYTKLCKIFL